MNKEILEQAITKAVDGGLKGYWAERYADCRRLDEMEYLTGENIYQEGHSLEELIYNHDFAKALWGEKQEARPSMIDYTDTDKLFTTYRTQPNWQYHLQAMVIADDPIQYLGDNTTR